MPNEDGARSATDGPLVFASSNPAIAALFTIKVGEWRVSVGNFSGVIYYVCDNKAEFTLADHGAAIYELPPEGFSMDPSKGMDSHEWVTSSVVTPLSYRPYGSAIEAMLGNRATPLFPGQTYLQR